MRFLSAILVPLCVAFSAWSQISYTVSVIDKSDSGAPVAISGTATFTDVFDDKSVGSWGSFSLRGRNLSTKSILLLLAYFDEAAPNQRETRHVICVDHFFWEEIAPGRSFNLPPINSRSQKSELRHGSAPATDPEAEVRVQYVQFTDGSSYGSKMAADGVLRLRLTILHSLQRLANTGGAPEFRALLATKASPGAGKFFEDLRLMQESRGTEATRAEVQSDLRVAQERMRRLQTIQSIQK